MKMKKLVFCALLLSQTAMVQHLKMIQVHNYPFAKYCREL